MVQPDLSLLFPSHLASVYGTLIPRVRTKPPKGILLCTYTKVPFLVIFVIGPGQSQLFSRTVGDELCEEGGRSQSRRSSHMDANVLARR